LLTLEVVAAIAGREVLPGVFGAVQVGALVMLGLVLHRAGLRDEDADDSSWVDADLDAVPYVITQPAARGHLLPWYRRVFHRAPVDPEPPRPPMTYRG